MPTGPAGDKEEGWVGTVSHQREHIPLKVGCYHCTVQALRGVGFFSLSLGQGSELIHEL